MREFSRNTQPEHYYHDLLLSKGLDGVQADRNTGAEHGPEVRSLSHAESELAVEQVAEVVPVEQPEQEEVRLPVAR